MERMPKRAPLARGVMLGICVVAMMGCGGGGGGENVRSDPPPPAPSTPTPPSPTPTAPELPVITDTWAHGRIINNFGSPPDPGKGIAIGVVSTGVDGQKARLGERLTAQFSYVDPASNDLTIPDKSGMGTDLARVTAEMRDETAGSQGLAWGADIVAARLVPDASGGVQRDHMQIPPERLLAMHQDLSGANVSVMLNAWGMSFGDRAVADAYAAAYSPFVVGHQGMVVVAAGDESRPQPTDLAALPSRSAGGADLESGWLTVAALDTLEPTRLASYANACGDAAAYCLVAPGDIAVLKQAGVRDSGTRTVHGSAFAAAQVAAATAALREKFPYLSTAQLRQILLGNAVDLGASGVDPTFGWGLLDYDRSMRGPARLLWGDFEVAIPDGTRAVWWNDMSGQAGVAVGSGANAAGMLGDASLHISGNNTFTGPLHIKAGLTVSLNGSMAAPITVDPDAYLYAWQVTLHSPVLNRGVMQVNSSSGDDVHTFIEGDVTNEGVLVNREQANTIFRGNLFLKAGGTFMVNALGNDPLRVQGRIEIDGDLYVAGLAEGYLARSRTEILVGEGGITGQFVQAYSTPMIDATFGYDANTVWLDVARIDAASVQGVSYTAARLGAAQRVEQAFGRLDHIVTADPDALVPADFSNAAGQIQRAADSAAVQRSLDSLSGELHDADGALALMALDGNRRAIESRVDALREGTASGAWSQSLDGSRRWSEYDVDTRGWMLGFDRRWNTNLEVGAALAEADGNAWHSQRSDRERNRQVDAQVYASWNLSEGGYLLGSAAFGRMQRWMHREVWLGDTGHRVSSDYAHRYGALALQSGRRIPFGKSTITPYVGVQAMQLTRDGFSEEGASGFGLTADDASMSATQAMAGARWSRDWAGGSTRWSLSGRIEWQRLLSQSDASIQARFTGMDAWAPIVADGLDRNVGLFGLGFEGGIGARTTLRFDLDSRYGDGEQWSGAMATWTTAF